MATDKRATIGKRGPRRADRESPLDKLYSFQAAKGGSNELAFALVPAVQWLL